MFFVFCRSGSFYTLETTKRWLRGLSLYLLLLFHNLHLGKTITWKAIQQKGSRTSQTGCHSSGLQHSSFSCPVAERPQNRLLPWLPLHGLLLCKYWSSGRIRWGKFSFTVSTTDSKLLSTVRSRMVHFLSKHTSHCSCSPTRRLTIWFMSHFQPTSSV